ncbi:MAG: GC-type dockerin domain-anchored protein [Planctomycetota bacterium]
MRNTAMRQRNTVSSTSRAITAAAGLAIACGLAAPASAQPDGVILQWFEQQWDEMEHRMPDFFALGYGATWLPPISKTFDPASPGYDPFERFDLGTPNAPTLYGTTDGFDAMLDAMHDAGGLAYIDIIMNHNSGRQTSRQFQLDGGYPGFWMGPISTGPFKGPTENWGDFHGGVSSGFLQSENPGGARYDRTRGDLVALIDIDQTSNNFFIRHPVDATDPQNIPAGTLRNLPDPLNAMLYPDTSLTPTVVSNPGTPNHPGTSTLTFYPFNTADPMAGDAVAENATGLLMRWTQWMLDVRDVDGFRLDAAKHIDSFFWDTFWDSSVHNRWENAQGQMTTPFSFGESTEGNFFIRDNLIRKDGFANRDTLDLTGAGSLRNLKSGFGSWGVIFDGNAGHIDNADDGLNNGSLGVFHLFSHDNGTQGDGGSAPAFPNARDMGFPMTAYLLMRPGPVIVYHNSRGVNRSFGFFPRAGYTNALGWDAVNGVADDTITTLVQLRNQYGRGFFIPLNGTDPTNQSFDDVLIFDRQTPSGVSNVITAVNKRYDSGFDQRSIQTQYPAGTRLVELTGNASNPVVDPNNSIPDLLVVASNGRITIRVPRNNTNGNEHGLGYVVYGESLPTASVAFDTASGTGAITGDPATTPPAFRRLTDATIITDDTFNIRVTTTQTDPFDDNTDDNAIFRFADGYEDFNNNGGVDIPASTDYLGGFEFFETLNQPLFGSGNANGQYVQTIDSDDLSEGYNYLTVRVFRHRTGTADPLFRELREVIYLDRECPAVELVGGDQTFDDDAGEIQITALDRTTDQLHVIVNLPQGQDPIAAASPVNRVPPLDRFDYRRTLTGLNPGENRVTVVAFEESGRGCFYDYTITVNTEPECVADTTTSGTNPGDSGFGLPDGTVDVADLTYFVEQWLDGNTAVADVTTANTNPGDPGYGVPDGSANTSDLTFFVEQWVAGCP